MNKEDIKYMLGESLSCITHLIDDVMFEQEDGMWGVQRQPDIDHIVETIEMLEDALDEFEED